MATEAHLTSPDAARSPSAGWKRWGRRLITTGLLVGAAYAGLTHRSELGKGISRLGHPAWPWLLAACATQASSMVAFARLQRWLLRCGGVVVRLWEMVGIALAGNTLSTSLPGGAAWAAGWIWGQLRRRSVERVLAGWVVLVAGALSSFALFLLVVVGAEVAGSRGPVSSLRWVERFGVLVAVILIGCLVALPRSRSLRARSDRMVAHAEGRSGFVAKVVRGVDSFGHQVRIVRPSPLAWTKALALALWNWVADLGTLVFSIWAVHASVPWRGLVIAYALTQISASLPITPGGLAVVEASLGSLLVAYGMPSVTAVTVVLLYRLISFWCLVPIGWASWGLLELAEGRSARGRHPRAFGTPGRREHPRPGPTYQGASQPALRRPVPSQPVPTQPVPTQPVRTVEVLEREVPLG